MGRLFGGGGSSTTTTQTGVPDYVQPYVEGSLAEAERLYQTGQLAQRAGLPTQGLQAQEKLALDALAGRGIYDLDDSIKRSLTDVAGQMQQGASVGGSLGSARSEAASQSALGRLGLEMQQAKQAQAAGGATALRDVDVARQLEQQGILDLPKEALATIFQFYGSPAVGTTQQTTAPKETK
jgi:hypothetical protein